MKKRGEIIIAILLICLTNIIAQTNNIINNNNSAFNQEMPSQSQKITGKAILENNFTWVIVSFVFIVSILLIIGFVFKRFFNF